MMIYMLSIKLLDKRGAKLVIINEAAIIHQFIQIKQIISDYKSQSSFEYFSYKHRKIHFH